MSKLDCLKARTPRKKTKMTPLIYETVFIFHKNLDSIFNHVPFSAKIIKCIFRRYILYNILFKLGFYFLKNPVTKKTILTTFPLKPVTGGQKQYSFFLSLISSIEYQPNVHTRLQQLQNKIEKQVPIVKTTQRGYLQSNHLNVLSYRVILISKTYYLHNMLKSNTYRYIKLIFCRHLLNRRQF